MIASLTSLLLVCLVLANLRLLGASRLQVCIRTVAAQGVALGLLPLLHASRPTLPHLLALAAAILLVKGVLFPRLLFRAQREANVRREVEPYVGFTPSMLFGVGSLAVAGYLAARLPLPGGRAARWRVLWRRFWLDRDVPPGRPWEGRRLFR